MEKPKSYKVAVYAWLIEEITKVARECGYAIGLHGSMNRDLDLMAMPWTEEAKSPAELVEAIRELLDARVLPDGTPCGKWDGEKHITVPLRQPEHKPHGRLAYNIHLHGGPYIDLSVMPRKGDGGGEPQAQA